MICANLAKMELHHADKTRRFFLFDLIDDFGVEMKANFLLTWKYFNIL